MTAPLGADELRLRYLLHTRGVGYAPRPPAASTPAQPVEDPMPFTTAFFAVIALAATAAVLMLRRTTTARDTAVLAGAILGICASAPAWSPQIGGLIGV